MNTATLAGLGIAAAVVNLAGKFLYVRYILQGKIKPERATWWIWFAVGLVGIIALIDAGATWSIALNVAQLIGMGAIAALSVKFGYGTFSHRDAVSIALAAIGIVLWQLTDQPLYALLAVIGIDTLGLWLVALKAWQAPGTEALGVWVISGAAAVIATFAVGKINPTQLLYPLYTFLANAIVTAIILYRRKGHARTILIQSRSTM